MFGGDVRRGAPRASQDRLWIAVNPESAVIERMSRSASHAAISAASASIVVNNASSSADIALRGIDRPE